jgi:hypothetical protein
MSFVNRPLQILLVALLAACGSSGSDSSSTTSSTSSSTSGSMKQPAGGACGDANACQGFACYCKSTGFQGCASVCVNSQCADGPSTCGDCGLVQDTFDHADPGPTSDCP